MVKNGKIRNDTIFGKHSLFLSNYSKEGEGGD